MDPPSHRSDGTRAYGKLESSEQAGQIPLVAVEKRQASQELAKGKAETGFSGWEEACGGGYARLLWKLWQHRVRGDGLQWYGAGQPLMMCSGRCRGYRRRAIPIGDRNPVGKLWWLRCATRGRPCQLAAEIRQKPSSSAALAFRGTLGGIEADDSPSSDSGIFDTKLIEPKGLRL